MAKKTTKKNGGTRKIQKQIEERIAQAVRRKICEKAMWRTASGRGAPSRAIEIRD